MDNISKSECSEYIEKYEAFQKQEKYLQSWYIFMGIGMRVRILEDGSICIKYKRKYKQPKNDILSA